MINISHVHLIIEIIYWPMLKCWTRWKLIILKLRTVCSSILNILFIERHYHLHIMLCFGQIIIQKNFKNNIFSAKYHFYFYIKPFQSRNHKKRTENDLWICSYFENTTFCDPNLIIFLWYAFVRRLWVLEFEYFGSLKKFYKNATPY